MEIALMNISEKLNELDPLLHHTVASRLSPVPKPLTKNSMKTGTK
jgi:hypothetical protein